MEISTNIEGGTAVLTLDGRLDAKNAPLLDAAITALPAETTGLVLDCTDLAYISSMGLRTLHIARKRFAAGGGVTLRKVRPALLEILDASGFSAILKIED